MKLLPSTIWSLQDFIGVPNHCCHENGEENSTVWAIQLLSITGHGCLQIVSVLGLFFFIFWQVFSSEIKVHWNDKMRVVAFCAERWTEVCTFRPIVLFMLWKVNFSCSWTKMQLKPWPIATFVYSIIIPLKSSVVEGFVNMWTLALALWFRI